MTTISIKSPDPVDHHVGTVIRRRRMQLGLSQEALADKLGLSFQQVQKYEKGVNRVSASRLVQIARILGISAGAMLPDETEAAPATDESARDCNAFLATRDGVVIARSVVRIADPKLRRLVADLVAGMAGNRAAA